MLGELGALLVRGDVTGRKGDRGLDDADARTAVGNGVRVEDAAEDEGIGDDQVVVVAGGRRVDRVEDGDVVEAGPVRRSS